MNLFTMFLFLLCLAPSLVAADDQPQTTRPSSLVSIDANGHFTYKSATPAVVPVSVKEARQFIKEENAKRNSRKPIKADKLKGEPVMVADDPLPCNQGTYPPEMCSIPLPCPPQPPPPPPCGYGGTCLAKMSIEEARKFLADYEENGPREPEKSAAVAYDPGFDALK